MAVPRNYLPATEQEVREMLDAIGARSVDDLFSDIPEALKLKKRLDLPEALSEPELMAELEKMASMNRTDALCFAGGGIYDHYIPAVVDHMLSRGEFYTAYTPYQPEVSQGTLTAIFQYQTMICELTGMDQANASMYDAATASAEASIMCAAQTGRKKIVVTRATNPRYRDVIRTYAGPRGFELVEVPFDPKTGQTDITALSEAAKGAACVIAQNPNYLGVIEDMHAMADAAHSDGGFFVAAVNPVSLAVLEAPRNYGADIAVGEGQSMGNGMSFGGPLLGFMATTSQLIRRMPGRLVGQTLDNRGQRAFVLTLQTREQHIRRENATSNICSNQALCALAATIYLSVLGPKGLRKVAEASMQKAHYLAKALSERTPFRLKFAGPFFNEFVIEGKGCSRKLRERLLEHGILGGIPLSGAYPELKGNSLWAVTELRTKEQMDRLVSLMEVEVE
ncbi:MAG: aminomethyl-transferring glycine dehydrogenase subunit GcvPA [Firmicutes bacterium]|nr:aminomethyl-transferring glycine dehydrogenase subunit GcvPA [Bacillota bacterium]